MTPRRAGPAHRYVFVGGLHRSGTSLVAAMLADLPGVGAIRGAPVPEQEGVYLQGAIPHTARHGLPGRFADDPAQHLVEGCRYDTRATRDRIEADWAPWFPPDVPWRVEKSPVNLLRMRLYQQLFPPAQFVVVLRHPVAVAQATARWTQGPHADLLAHWVRAHDICFDDMRHLHAVIALRYEDLVAHPQRMQDTLAAFLGLPVMPLAREIGDRTGAHGPPPRITVTAGQAATLARAGYTASATLPWPPHIAHPLRAVREAVAQALSPV